MENPQRKRILLNRIYDDNLQHSDRVRAFDEYLTMAYEDELVDVMSRYDQILYLNSYYDLTPSTIEFMKTLCQCQKVPSYWRYNLIMGMIANSHYEMCYDLMMKLVDDSTLNLGYRADMLLVLYATDEYSEFAQERIVNIVTSLKEDKIESIKNYWYRFIMDTVQGKPVKVVSFNATLYVEVPNQFVQNYLKAYMLNENLNLDWRMQCAQMLLMHHKGECDEVVSWLTQLIKDHYHDEDEGIVGEAYDILIRASNESEKWEAELMAYGARHMKGTQGYAHNSQNSHMFASQAIAYLDILCARSKLSLSELEADYGSVETWIYKLMAKHQKPREYEDVVLHTLSRLYYDSSKLGRHEISPRTMMVLIKQEIMSIEDQEDLLLKETRLLDELKEMNGTCTTGHFTRIVGVVHDYEITYAQQLSSNLDGRFHARLKRFPEEDYELVIDEITKPSSERSEKYKMVIDEIMVGLYQELHQEFVDSNLMEDKVFDKIFHEFEMYWK